MIYLTEEIISTFDHIKLEENLLYLRYLLIREKRETEIMRYYDYIEMLERRRALLQMLAATGDKELNGSERE